jgi:hypothetical protein
MGTHDTKEKQGEKSGAGGSQKASMSMSTSDHTNFVDLLLQQAAQSAIAAMGVVDPKAQFDATARAIARADAALSGYTVPETGTNPRQLFRSVDSVFMALYDLFHDVQASEDIWLKASALNVKRVMTSLNDRFAPAGWKVPRSVEEVEVRAKAADKAGATVLSTSEKGQLGRLHLQAARQYVLGTWEQIVGGNLASVAVANHHLTDAMGLLVDPHFSGEMTAITGEVTATEDVISHLVMAIEEHDSSRLAGLRDIAKQLDVLLKLVGKEPHWAARVGQAREAPPNQAAGGSSATGKSGAGNDGTPEPPRAEPPMHRPEERRRWSKKVHIKDTNYLDEYLGYVELFFEAYRTASGQIYIEKAAARNHLVGRANEYLSVGADVSATSVAMKGQRFADVLFDVKIGGPHKTETSTVGVSLKGSASNKEKTEGVEVGASVTFSTSVSSQGTRSFRRAFRISSQNEPAKILDSSSGKPTPVDTAMSLEEVLDLHEDFDDFELDDDDVGDDVTSLYANWVLHSYSD